MAAPPAPGAQLPAPPRAGRDLRAAIAVGVLLAALVVVPLYAYKPAFVAYVAVVAAIGLTELARTWRRAGREVAVPPLVAGAGLMVFLAYNRGSEGLVTGLLATLLAALAWESGRLLWHRRGPAGATDPEADPAADPARRALRSAAATMFTAVYVPFLAGFAALLAAPVDGTRRVTVFIATVVCSDVGGFAAGVLAGRHPLAPTVSPKKSWEGLGGSVLACLVGASLLMDLLLHVAAWKGVLFGAAVALVATAGDLAESLIKRDLGVKDMGTLLPGHGGVMDRLDSLLLTAPVAWLLLSALAPHHR
jgi:phosphatidate cytidylyltransferase